MGNFPFRTLTESEFELYTGSWQVAVNMLDGSLLRSCFTIGDTITNYVGYSAQQIAWLVSTPGAARIEARFVCENLLGGGGFGVVLYAVDTTGNRISAYYLSDGANKIPPPSDAPMSRTVSSGSGQGAIQVPHYMVVDWLDYWKNIWGEDGQGPQRDMFINPYGTLQGYSYNVGDLSQSLFNSQPIKHVDFYLLFNFCLHEYKNPRGETQYTFGMVIRLYNNGGKPTISLRDTSDKLALTDAEGSTDETMDGDDEMPTTAFYDMSLPCPPNTYSND